MLTLLTWLIHLQTLVLLTHAQVYAGYFFCWLAMITNMVLAIHLFWNVGPAKIGPQ